MKKELYNFIKKISPVELAKLREKRQDTSTRDKNSLLKKVEEIEEILQKLSVEISLKKKE
ncbi:hypothetical protein KRE40_12205 [Elizabethkingia meningoseptica]|uniref:hypothetical protein n=1 Tax=Elizabethkingia TaxID=308865 RepID=UPI0023B0B6CC|nr:hypothetical protein [Elizabethkingia meningoseptica]MCT4315508.1 hypothetical protein [Elizabethkingia anophelis]MDE5509406.1 hypothetical protein [Elizabethkingia meningoseptica]HAY3534670.1 hypothetical protein [Elizabethkingia anophelis]HAY3546786.1 hypothetical protein [Elizabethkingia anophelis]